MNDLSGIQKICREALREDGGTKTERKLAKMKRLGISENSLVSPVCTKYIVDLRDRPVSYKNFISLDPNVRATSGMYYVRYVPVGSRHTSQGKPFVIGQDMLHFCVAVSNVQHWHCLAKRIPELGWIERNTTLTNSLFGFAKKHPNMNFTFTIDWERYGDKMTEIAHREGIDIDNKPFVSYKCSTKEYQEKYADKQVRPKVEFDEYRDIINDVDKEFVKSE